MRKIRVMTNTMSNGVIMKNIIIHGGSVALFLFFLSFNVWAQTYNFSNCEIAIHNHTDHNLPFAITLDGFIFDETLEYNDDYATVTSGTLSADESWGYDAPFSQDGSASGDIDSYKDVFGCGRYKLYVNDGTNNKYYILNCIDGKFGAGPQSSVYRVLFELYNDHVEVFVQAYGSSNIYQSDDLVAFSGTYNTCTDNYYRDMINGTGQWSTYSRELTSSNSETFHIDGGSVPTYGVNAAILDVNPDITSSISVPTNRTLQIEVDDALTSGRTTTLKFHSNTGLTVNGSLLTNTRYSNSATKCTSSAGTPAAGDWSGILVDNNGLYKPIVLNFLNVYYSANGIRLYDCVTPATYFCSVTYTSKNAFTVSGNNNGTHSHLHLNNNSYNNILVTDTSYIPAFTNCSLLGFSPTPTTGGNGVVIENGSYAYFDRCTITRHAYHGIIILTGSGAYVTSCDVGDNGVASDPKLWDGIHVFEDYYWATVRYSNIYENNCGIRLNDGHAAGYYDARSPDPLSPDSIGHNCIHNNNYNLFADQGQFEMGREYDFGTTTIHYLGWLNSVYDPYTLQGFFDNSTNAFLQRNWWDNDHIFFVRSSNFYNDPEMFADSTGCTEEFSRSGSLASGELSSTGINALYRQWSNLTSQPAQLRQSVLGSLSKLTPAEVNFAFNLVLRASKLSDAESFFKSVTAMNLGNYIQWRGWTRLGLTRMAQKHYSDALQAYTSSISYTTRGPSSNYTISHAVAAYLQHYMGNTSAAVTRLDSLLNAFPDDRELQMAWILLAGTHAPHPKASVNQGEIFDYSLSDAYPNPFNPTTTIRFTIPEAQHVRLVVRNALGVQLAVLKDGMCDTGTNSAIFDAANLPSGVYIYQLQTESTTLTKKMSLVR